MTASDSSGEFDGRDATAETIWRLAGIDRPVDLDLTDVTFIDSIGLRVRIVAVNSRLRRVFDITGTTELLLDGLGPTPR
ncbi:MAG TPA: STAS domain-containing protein [Acidimicrobiales bacterium]|nr:STAS domain-containing protein [Acidimicrobiales bacterium]